APPRLWPYWDSVKQRDQGAPRALLMGFSRGKGLPEELAVQDLPDLARQGIRAERLLQEIGPGVRDSVSLKSLARVRGDEEGAQGRALPREPLRPGDTVAVRHDDVAQEQVDLAGEGPVHLG